jgi:GYF domain 2
MQIYINKNGQQLGPFEESKVAEMLQNRQLSPNDLGIRRGEKEWQNLGAIFPNVKPSISFPNTQNAPTVNIQPPVQKKSSGLKFGLIGCGGLLLLGFIGLIGLSVFRGKKDSSVNNVNVANSNTAAVNSNTTAVNSSPTKPTPDAAKQKELASKDEEFLKMTFPLKPNANPLIKGKVHIVQSNESTDYEEDSDYEYETSFDLAAERFAESVEEIDTLIQIICKKGAYYGTYDSGGKGYTNNCKVTITDFKGKVSITQKTLTNGLRKALVKSSDFDSNNIYINARPSTQIYKYLSVIPIDKPITLEEEELHRLNFSKKLDAEAKIKGKAKITAKYPFLDDEPEFKFFTVDELTSERDAKNLDELDTLIQIDCQRGSIIGKKKKTTFYSNKCTVNLIDYKNSVIFAQKVIENKKLDGSSEGDDYEPNSEVLDFPEDEIKSFLKTMVGN